MTPGHRPDPWQSLRQRTPARVALGRAGSSLPTAEILKFALDHAEARDAVHTPFVAALLVEHLKRHSLPVLSVESMASGKDPATAQAVYLRRPEAGRRLKPDDRRRLQDMAGDGCDVAIVLGDGLSATAANGNGPAFVAELLTRLTRLRVGPIVVARKARVAIQDDIGHALKARCCVIVLGERPGLGAADSLGVYLVYDPGPGKSDADRNCVSNVRPAGLPLPIAADTVAYLIDAALARRISGVTLKDDRTPALAPSPGMPGEGWGGGPPSSPATLPSGRPPP